MNLPPFPPERAEPVTDPIPLPAQCGTAAAPALHKALADAVANGTPFSINASAVETVGQSMLQLLLAARAAAPDLCIIAPSPAFAERIRALQLDTALGLTARHEG